MDTILLAAGFTPLPQRIKRLLELSYNLWWTWHPEAVVLFQKIDAELWEEVYHNPVKFFREVRQVALDRAAQSTEFLRYYHQVMADFDAYQVFGTTWYAQTYPHLLDKQIAYFSAEFGLHECLPIYSGGLGMNLSIF
jgi:starch phosphorylase